MTESQLTSKITAEIRKAYPRAFVYKISDRFYSGIPDILVIIGGMPMFMEVKTKVGKVSKIQQYTLDKIRMAGCPAEVVRTIDEAAEFVRRIATGG